MPPFHFEDYETTQLGMDEFLAEVSIDACRACGTRWLVYRTEDEGFSRSGRWWRVELDKTPIDLANAKSFLDEQSEGFIGGSYYGHAGEPFRHSRKIAAWQTVWLSPRETMREVLGNGAKGTFQLTVMLGLISGACSSFDDPFFPKLPLIALVPLNTMIGALVFFMVLAMWVLLATRAGRYWGGTGNARSLWAAFAWAGIVVIPFQLAGLIFDLLAIASGQPTSLPLSEEFDPQRSWTSKDYVEAVGGAWYLAVASACVSEAHQISILRGFLVVLMALLGASLLVIIVVFFGSVAIA